MCVQKQATTQLSWPLLPLLFTLDVVVVGVTGIDVDANFVDGDGDEDRKGCDNGNDVGGGGGGNGGGGRECSFIVNVEGDCDMGLLSTVS